MASDAVASTAVEAVASDAVAAVASDAAEDQQPLAGMASFEFAWKQPRYSDRVLRLHLSPGEAKPGSIEGGSGSEISEQPGRRPVKRRRCNPASPSSTSDTLAIRCDSSVDVKAVATEDVPVSSVILAKESLFFRRLFDGECFKESKLRIIDIHLNAGERTGFLDLLRFIYTGKIDASSAEDIAAVWLLAQRFLVESCMEHAMLQLKSFPLTVERSNYFLDLASVVDQTVDLKVLMNMSISFLASHFTTATVMNAENPGRWEHVDDFQKLPITALELLLKSDLLQAVHEEAVFHAVRGWVSVNCNNADDVRDCWNRLGPLIRWPHIETPRLRALSNAPEVEYVEELILEALLYKASNEEGRQKMAAEVDACQKHRFQRRVKHALPVECVSVDLPVTHAVVCFNLPLDSWNGMKTATGPLCSERFCVSGYFFIWLLQLVRSPGCTDASKKRVTLGLVSLSAPPTPICVEISVSVWDSNLRVFAHKYKGVHTVKKEVRERIAMCLDCFGRELQDILDPRNGCLFKEATWFRAEVQVKPLDTNPSE